jgi:hypothetical protein
VWPTNHAPLTRQSHEVALSLLLGGGCLSGSPVVFFSRKPGAVVISGNRFEVPLPLPSATFAVFNVGIGVAGCTSWCLLLPAVLAPLAIRTESTGDAGPGWAFLLFIVAPIAACLVARSAWAYDA